MSKSGLLCRHAVDYKLPEYRWGNLESRHERDASSALARNQKPHMASDQRKASCGLLGRDELQFNRRKRSDLFVDTLRHMVTAPALTFEKLPASVSLQLDQLFSAEFF